MSKDKKKEPFWKRIRPTILTSKEGKKNTGPKEKIKIGVGLKIKF